MDTIRNCFQKKPQQDNTLYNHGLPYPLSLLCTGPKVDIAILQDSLSNALCFHSGWVPSSATKCSSHYPTNTCPPSVSFTGSDGLPLGLSIEWTRRQRGFAKLSETKTVGNGLIENVREFYSKCLSGERGKGGLSRWYLGCPKSHDLLPKPEKADVMNRTNTFIPQSDPWASWCLVISHSYRKFGIIRLTKSESIQLQMVDSNFNTQFAGNPIANLGLNTRL